jgi:uncharacterized ferritin-like protein (DUF455 family)
MSYLSRIQLSRIPPHVPHVGMHGQSVYGSFLLLNTGKESIQTYGILEVHGMRQERMRPVCSSTTNGIRLPEEASATTTNSPESKRALRKHVGEGWRGLDTWRREAHDRSKQNCAVWSSSLGACSFSEASKAEQNVYMELRKDALEQVSMVSCGSLAEYGRRVLSSADPLVKAELTHKAWREFTSGAVGVHMDSAGDEEKHLPSTPARPEKPSLVPAREIPTLKETTLHRSAYTLHNLAHVELNAIDLAWDTVVRFSHAKLPMDFYADFARVADDESRHLGWCLQRLGELNCRYGDMPAHNLLWEGCMVSSSDIRERLAVVPMSQEARGLDAGARLAERLVGWGDNVSAAIVARIAEEEHAHVAVGVLWFRAICSSLGDDSKDVFIQTLTELCPDLLRPPFNHNARWLVGLPREYYDETAWNEESRAQIEYVRKRRRDTNPHGHGMMDETSDTGHRLSPIDFDILRDRLCLFLSQEEDMVAQP